MATQRLGSAPATATARRAALGLAALGLAAALLGGGACVMPAAGGGAEPGAFAPRPPGPSLGGPGDPVLADILAAPDLGDLHGDGDGAAPGAPPGAVAATRATVVILFASWCTHCHDELAILGALRAAHPGLRVVGVNYRGHEEYDGRGNAQAVENYVRNFAPWLRVVPADERLFDELGRPPKVPTMYVYDATGARVETYDRQTRASPDAGELDAVLARLGA